MSGAEIRMSEEMSSYVNGMNVQYRNTVSNVRVYTLNT